MTRRDTDTPTIKQAQAIITEIAGHHFKDITERLGHAVEREVTQGTNRPDGYPRSTLPGGGGGGVLVDRDRPELGSVKLTPVEGAAEARSEQTGDRLRRLTKLAIRRAECARADLEALVKALDEIDKEQARPHSPQGCELCTAAGVTREGKPVPWEHKGTVGGKLDVAMHLCKPHYWYADAHPDAPVPTEAQTRWYDEHGTWRVRQAG